jgi:5'-3' exonuclease
MNDAPIEWAAEKCLVEQRRMEGMEKLVWDFRPTWKEEYAREALWGAEESHVCEVFCKTLAWTLDYYIGRPVDETWYYPWFLPPLFQSLHEYLQKNTHVLSPEIKHRKSLTAIGQLAMVLPVSSMHLLPTALQQLPQRYPYAWPTSWGHFSLGRRFLWECEPLIPLIQPSQIENWIEECMESEE